MKETLEQLFLYLGMQTKWEFGIEIVLEITNNKWLEYTFNASFILSDKFQISIRCPFDIKWQCI